MCPPKYYEVAYAINPWMTCGVGRVCAESAARQWEQLHGLLGGLAHVSLLEPRPGLPDMPFTANAGAILRGRVVVSRFLHPERRGEEAHYEG
jgi:N-dimethylarginine dimethylaminohydrolase